MRGKDRDRAAREQEGKEKGTQPKEDASRVLRPGHRPCIRYTHIPNCHSILSVGRGNLCVLGSFCYRAANGLVHACQLRGIIPAFLAVPWGLIPHLFRPLHHGLFKPWGDFALYYLPAVRLYTVEEMISGHLSAPPSKRAPFAVTQLCDLSAAFPHVSHFSALLCPHQHGFLQAKAVHMEPLLAVRLHSYHEAAASRVDP